MRFVTPLALGLMLALGSAPAAMAKDKKDDQQQGPQLKLSKEFIAAAVKAQDAMKANDFAGAKAALDAAEPLATTPDEQYQLNALRLNVGLQAKDEVLQRKAVEAMLASGKVAPADVGKYNFFAGQFATNAGDFDGAAAHFQKAADAGYDPVNTNLLIAESHFKKAIGGGSTITPAGRPEAELGLASLRKAIDLQKASGQPVPANWYQRGFSIAYVAGSASAPEWAALNVSADPTPKNWRNVLRVYQDEHRDLTVRENLDLMRLMLLTGAMDSERDFAEYADAANKSGLPGEVKSVIDQGRSSGKLAAAKLNDYYQIATTAIPKDKASLPASEADSAKAANGKTAASTADAYLSYAEFAKAANLYKLALQKGGVDANEVNTRLGIALAQSGDSAGAKAAFGAVSGGNRKAIANFWLLYLSTKAA